MSRNRLLAVVAAVLACTIAFMLWERVTPSKAVNTGGVTTTATATEKTGTVER